VTARPLVPIVRSRVARIAVGPSTVRGRGHSGTVRAARAFLRKMDLRAFSSGSRAFASVLDSATERLRKALPRAARRWGIARKLLNIFLRDCFCTTYLSHAFHLGRLEGLLELPLDSITARELRGVAGRGVLPAWKGVKRVTPETNRVYQEVALVEARRRGLARVHLDALWWSKERD
jgi:hypothetical protein